MDYYQLGYTSRRGGLSLGAQRHFQTEAFKPPAPAKQLDADDQDGQEEAVVDKAAGRVETVGAKHEKDHIDGKRPREESGQVDHDAKKPKQSVHEGEGKHDRDGETPAQETDQGGTTATHQEGDGDAPKQRVESDSVRSEPKQGDAKQASEEGSKAGEVQQRRGDAGASSGQVRAGSTTGTEGGDGPKAADDAHKE